MLREGANEEAFGKHTEEILVLMFPDCFLVCVPKQHILKTSKLRIGAKDVLLPCRFAHPCNTVSKIESKCFCNIVFSFASALRNSYNELQQLGEDIQFSHARQSP